MAGARFFSDGIQFGLGIKDDDKDIMPYVWKLGEVYSFL